MLNGGHSKLIIFVYLKLVPLIRIEVLVGGGG